MAGVARIPVGHLLRPHRSVARRVAREGQPHPFRILIKARPMISWLP
jgi:hypothetical protein